MACAVDINMIVIGDFMIVTDGSMIVNDDYRIVNYTPRVMPQFGESVQRPNLLL